jgi:hypothetical protein
LLEFRNWLMTHGNEHRFIKNSGNAKRTANDLPTEFQALKPHEVEDVCAFSRASSLQRAEPLSPLTPPRGGAGADRSIEEVTLCQGSQVVPDREHFWAPKPGLPKKIPIGNVLLISRLILL